MIIDASHSTFQARVHAVASLTLIPLLWGCASRECTAPRLEKFASTADVPKLVRDGEGGSAVVMFYLSDGKPWTTPHELGGVQFAMWPDGFVVFRPDHYKGLKVATLREYRVTDAVNRMASAIQRVPERDRLCNYERYMYGFYAVEHPALGDLLMCADQVETDEEPRATGLELGGILAWEILQLTEGEEYTGIPSITWQRSSGN